MVSRRNFITIFIMMAVLFVMFQFSQVIKNGANQYDVNEFVKEEIPSGTDKWKPSDNTELSEDNRYIVFFGDKDSKLSDVVEQWCTYTKRELVQKDELAGYALDSKDNPEMILIDSQAVELGSDGENLFPMVKWGIPMVFCTLPDADTIDKSEILQGIFGIRTVVEKETPVNGIHLFSGFLLGGEAIYEAKTEKEKEELQDMQLNVPWYTTSSGTKVYMAGRLDESKAKREEFPCLIWRNSYRDTKIFSVCGDYMSTLAGMGILDAFVYELSPYQVYPVVNAQNVIIANFPNFSEENRDEIKSLYSREPQMVFKELMWPSISAMTETTDIKLSCMFNPQYDYLDKKYPQPTDVAFYLQQLKELGSEAGMSLKYKENSDFATMLQADKAFYDALNSKYQYQAVYADKSELENVRKNVGKDGLLKNVKTMATTYQEGEHIVSYLTDGVTLQYTTGNARKHTVMDNFVLRGIQTAMGYSNVLLDLQAAVWPEDEKDQWQHLYDDMSSNVNTYWSGKNAFEQTTLSESDARVRTFLNLDYADARTGNTIQLQISNVKTESWFLLRTHEEKIVDIRGGEYELLEEDVYLIKALEEKVEIDVEPVTLKEQKTL